MRRKDLEVDGLAIDALVVSCDSRRLVLNLSLDIAKIIESPVRDVMEFSPLVPSGLGRVPVTNIAVFFPIIAGHIDELQDEGSPSNDAAATGKKISTNDILKNGGLARGLGPDYNLQSADYL